MTMATSVSPSDGHTATVAPGAILGVSVTRGFLMNSVTVPRLPGEAVGGICKLAAPG